MDLDVSLSDVSDQDVSPPIILDQDVSPLIIVLLYKLYVSVEILSFRRIKLTLLHNPCDIMTLHQVTMRHYLK